MKNIYRHQFISACPENAKPIVYDLEIQTDGRMIPVEHILMACALHMKGFHEAIADSLFERFGGHQLLKAHHHGVDIETQRGGL